MPERMAVELAVTITAERGGALTYVLALAFFLVSVVFVWRSFYRMRIRGGAEPGPTAVRSGVHEAARGN